jgi:hypothetical protein
VANQRDKKIEAEKRKKEGGLSTSGLERGKSRNGKCSPSVLSADGAFSQAGGKGEGVSRAVSVKDGGGFSAGGNGSCGGRG